MPAVPSPSTMPPPYPETPPLPPWVGSGLVPSLGGLRAVAIASVLYAHLGLRNNLGHLGVTLFFVISGFLITLLMLRENERTQTLHLRDFYKRRTLRIVPALSFFLLVVFSLQCARLVYIAPKYWIAALTYTMCYVTMDSLHPEASWDIAHTWSLSVEEHFYLIWPLLFFACKPKSAYKILLVYLMMVPLLRFVVSQYFGQIIMVNDASLTEMGSIAVGCAAAYLVFGEVAPPVNAALRRFPGRLWIAGGALVALEMVLGSDTIKQGNNHFVSDFETVWGDPLSAVGFALILLGAVYGKNAASRLLNCRPVVFIGTISYSLYLWQQLFTRFGIFAHRTGVGGHWSVTLCLIFACSLFSYYLIEVPFLRVKNRKR